MAVKAGAEKRIQIRAIQDQVSLMLLRGRECGLGMLFSVRDFIRDTARRVVAKNNAVYSLKPAAELRQRWEHSKRHVITRTSRLLSFVNRPLWILFGRFSSFVLLSFSPAAMHRMRDEE